MRSCRVPLGFKSQCEHLNLLCWEGTSHLVLTLLVKEGAKGSAAIRREAGRSYPVGGEVDAEGVMKLVQELDEAFFLCGKVENL